MKKAKKLPTTIYLEPGISRAIRVKAAVSGRTVSDITNDSLRRLLVADREDIRIARQRLRRERGEARDYLEVLQELKRDGLL
jgi:hypothetical protein